MRVVWAYADWSGEGKHDLATEPTQLWILILSVVSWKKLEPHIRRVLYVDKSVYRFLEERYLLSLWTDVHLVDFQKELVETHKVNFFAYPKLWACAQQTEPFVISDTDMVLLAPVSKWLLDPKKAWGRIYDSSSNVSVQTVDMFYLKRILEIDVRYGGMINLRGCVNGGFIYYPDPEKARIATYVVFSLAKYLDTIPETHVRWVAHEEACLPAICEKIGMKIHHLPETGIRLHVTHPDFTEDPNVLRAVQDAQKLFELELELYGDLCPESCREFLKYKDRGRKIKNVL